jgi:hypothetical protein
MNLQTSIELYLPSIMGGGLGSGCNPAVGRCGRRPGWKASSGVSTDEHWKHKDSGYYRDSRLKLHTRLIEKYQHRPGYKNPVAHLVAGGTASGKSVVAKMALAELRTPAMLNTDLIRADLPEFKQVMGTHLNGLLQEEAGRVRDFCLVSAAAHSNDILLDSPGSLGTLQKLEALESAGYRVVYDYVHRPVEEAIVNAAYRAKTAENPADRREVPEDIIRSSHSKARVAFSRLAAGREVRVYDAAGTRRGDPPKLIYHRLANGTVLVHDKERVRRMVNDEEPKIDYGF